VEIAERDIEVDGLPVHLRRAGDAPLLYVHGVPTSSWIWSPFLEHYGGLALDLPGFGGSAKPGSFDYSISGYDRFLESFLDAVGLERCTLVIHDWGSVALALAQRLPERISRVLLFSAVPLLPDYRWHGVARGWRTPVVGELLMGFTRPFNLRRTMPRPLADHVWAHFDHGTQRAILRLHRASPPEALARAGERLGELRCPALILWPKDDPYAPPEFGRRYAEALGGETELEMVEGGHWAWQTRPALVERPARFLAATPV
jgi:pimeloyl-ACP methyl ester carboxylesterase